MSVLARLPFVSGSAPASESTASESSDSEDRPGDATKGSEDVSPGDSASGDSSPVHDDDAAPPWLQARYEFGGAYADLAKGKRNWQVAALTALVLCMILAVGLIMRVSTSGITPYVVEVDELGRARYAGVPAEKQTVSDVALKAELSALVRDLRTVSSDAVIQKQILSGGLVHLRGDARDFISRYYGEEGNNPVLLGEEMRRTAKITSLLRVPDSKTWKVEWVETTNLRGGGSGRAAWQGYLTVARDDPTEKEVDRNPLGIFVTSLEWTETSKLSE